MEPGGLALFALFRLPACRRLHPTLSRCCPPHCHPQINQLNTRYTHQAVRTIWEERKELVEVNHLECVEPPLCWSQGDFRRGLPHVGPTHREGLGPPGTARYMCTHPDQESEHDSTPEPPTGSLLVPNRPLSTTATLTPRAIGPSSPVCTRCEWSRRVACFALHSLLRL